MKIGSAPYSIVGSPEPGTGTKILSPQEIVALLDKPGFRAAVDRVEKKSFGGKASAVKMMVRKQAQHDAVMDGAVKYNKNVIDMAKKKKEGKF